MPTLTALVCVEDVMEALDMVELPAACSFKAAESFTIDVEVDQGQIDDKATEEEAGVVRIEPDHNDLRDGLRSLAAGDFSMASVLLVRAFDDVDPVAQRIVEEECRMAGRKQAA